MPHTIESLTNVEINTFLNQQKKSHFYKRILFLKHKKQGKTHKQIAQLIGVCEKTLTNWMTLFSEGGMEGLVNISYDRRDSKLQAIEPNIRKKVQQGDITTLASCKSWLKEKHKLEYGISNIHWFFKKNGIVLQKDKASTR